MAALLCLPDPPASTGGSRGTKRQPSAAARRPPAGAGAPSAGAEAHLRALQGAAVDAGAVRALLTEVSQSLCAARQATMNAAQLCGQPSCLH